MNARKLDRLLSNQSTIATKVYECVPIKEAWSVGQVVSEMHRQGYSPDYPIVHGCLNHLAKDGLIKEVHGLFSRVKTTKAAPRKTLTLVPATDPQPTRTPDTMKDEAPKSAPIINLQTSLDKLSDLSSCLRHTANQVDDAILELQAAVEQKEAEFSKTRKAIQALRELGL